MVYHNNCPHQMTTNSWYMCNFGTPKSHQPLAWCAELWCPICPSFSHIPRLQSSRSLRAMMWGWVKVQNTLVVYMWKCKVEWHGFSPTVKPHNRLILFELCLNKPTTSVNLYINLYYPAFECSCGHVQLIRPWSLESIRCSFDCYWGCFDCFSAVIRWAGVPQLWQWKSHEYHIMHGKKVKMYGYV
jgi:hypothetical protein